MLFLLGLAKDVVVRLSQSIREANRGTVAIWDIYNLTARLNSVCMYKKVKKHTTPSQF